MTWQKSKSVNLVINSVQQCTCKIFCNEDIFSSRKSAIYSWSYKIQFVRAYCCRVTYPETYKPKPYSLPPRRLNPIKPFAVDCTWRLTFLWSELFSRWELCWRVRLPPLPLLACRPKMSGKSSVSSNFPKGAINYWQPSECLKLAVYLIYMVVARICAWQTQDLG